MRAKYYRGSPVWVPKADGGGYVPAAVKVVLDGQSVIIKKSALIPREMTVETDLLVPIESVYLDLPTQLFTKKNLDRAFKKMAGLSHGRWIVRLVQTNNNKEADEPFEIYNDNAEKDDVVPKEELQEEEAMVAENNNKGETDICGSPSDDFDDDEEDLKEKQNAIKRQFLSDMDSEDDGEDQWAAIKEELDDSDEWVPDSCATAANKPKRNVLFPTNNPRHGQKRQLSEYEEIQQRNIEERRKLLLNTVADAKKELFQERRKPKKAMRKLMPVGPPSRLEPILLRNRAVSGIAEDQLLSDGYSKKRWSPQDEEEGEGEPPVKRLRISYPARWATDPNVDTPTPEDITDEMLDNVADNVMKDKIYDKVFGTSCHQCRQKTMDTKTVCRSGTCRGVQGAFCGVCLKNRYGQDARQALRDPDWKCPPCIGKCNCSICRTRAGKCATGILIPLARDRGHESVMHYLDSLQK